MHIPSLSLCPAGCTAIGVPFQFNKTAATTADSFDYTMSSIESLLSTVTHLMESEKDPAALALFESMGGDTAFATLVAKVNATVSDCGGGDRLAAEVTLPKKLEEISRVEGKAASIVHFKCMLHLVSNLVNQMNVAMKDVEKEIEAIVSRVEGCVMHDGILFKVNSSLIQAMGFLTCKLLHSSYDDGYNLSGAFNTFLLANKTNYKARPV